ncbi:OB-fold nucleic acid binding domain-containing protein, partial [Zoogloea sp.]|uniref:OB-fold nucleic acid binding domain-containing protein n=1 Tax=Zoogloea sp. TaxID=49181 RepID=UPI002CE4C67B
TMAGVVMEVRAKMTARGKIAFVLLDDGTTPREVSVFSETFDNNRQRIVVDEVLIVEAKVSNDDFSGGYRIVADKLMTLGEARCRYARALQLKLNGEVGEAGGVIAAAERLQTVLEPFRKGDCPIRVRYRNADAEADFPLGPGWRVRPDDSLLESLREWLPTDSVEVIYP